MYDQNVIKISLKGPINNIQALVWTPVIWTNDDYR